MRTLVVGDIHGGLRALQQVLERCDYDASNDQLIFLGDYVDGWSQSAEVIDELIHIKDNTTIKPIFLLGNHDEWLINFLVKGQLNYNWLNNGGKSTIQSYEKLVNSDGGEGKLDEHRKFVSNLVEHYVDEENRAFVHAGCNGDEELQFTIRHTKVWDRHMWNRVLSGKSIKQYKELYIGHTTTLLYVCKPHFPESKLQEVNKRITVPMNRQNVWNIDTGGGWSGKLTIMDIDTKQFWQSDFVKDLYPEEEGR